MSVITSSSVASSPGAFALANQDSSVSIVTSASAGSTPSFQITQDGQLTLVVDPAMARALLDQLDESRLGSDVTVDTQALLRLMAQEQATEGGAPMYQALEAALEAGIDQFQRDFPLAFSECLAEFARQGLTPPLSMFDILSLLGAKAVDCSISLMKTGAETQAATTLRIYENRMDNVDTLTTQASDTEAAGTKEVIAQGIGAGLSIGIGSAGGVAGYRSANLHRSAAEAGAGITGTAPAVTGVPNVAPPGAPVVPAAPVAAAGGLDAHTQVLHRQAAAALHPATFRAKHLDNVAASATPMSQGTAAATGAADKAAETEGRVVGIEAQAKTTERDAESGVDESLKTTGERSQSSGLQGASDAISNVQQARNNLTESMGKMASPA